MSMDQADFQELLGAYGNRIYSYARYFLRDREDAQDVVQEAFLRLWQRCRATERQGRVAWLMRVTHNLCIDVKRRRQTARDHVRVWDPESLAKAPALAGGGGSPERELELSEIQHQLLGALATLPAATQSIMLMHYFQGLTYAEIGRILEIGVNTIKVRVHRGKRQLRGLLAEKLVDQITSKRETG